MKVVQKRDLPPRVILYGPEKIGKTTFGAGAEKPIFICTEEGADNLPVDKVDFGGGRIVAYTWGEILAALEEIATTDHDYKTVVIDTWNYACARAAETVCDEIFAGKWGKFHAYGGNQGYAATVEAVRPALRHLDVCRGKGMTVILLVHEGLNTIKDPIQGDFSRYSGDTDKRLWNLAAQWADVIGHATYDYTVIENRDGQGNVKKGRAMGTNTRSVRFAGTAAEAAGCRVGYELPETLPLSFSAFADALGHDTETIDQVKALWGVLNNDEVKKALSWLGVTKLEDASSHKLRELLTRLQAKAAEQTTKEEENVA